MCKVDIAIEHGKVMDKELLVRTIDKYFAGEASSEEMAILNSWFNELKNNPSLISSLSSVELEQISEKMFSKISKAIDEHTEKDVRHPVNRDVLKNIE